VAEPNVNPARVGDFVIRQGAGTPVANHSKSLFDYITLINLYQPCASVAQGAAAPLNLSPSPNRCQSLRDKGLLKSDTPAGQATEAQQIINGYGILPEQNFHPAFARVLERIELDLLSLTPTPMAVSASMTTSAATAWALRTLPGIDCASCDVSGDPVQHLERNPADGR
jgi:hypothetical protein